MRARIASPFAWWRGGLREIEVVDDGEGIPPEQLALAVRRHATSKLHETEDLRRVTTLGFRGEGLASIAAVARLEITSRTSDARDRCAHRSARRSRSATASNGAAPPGTRVVARDLFGNVPVRRDFLQSIGAEFARISTWLGNRRARVSRHDVLARARRPRDLDSAGRRRRRAAARARLRAESRARHDSAVARETARTRSASAASSARRATIAATAACSSSS